MSFKQILLGCAAAISAVAPAQAALLDFTLSGGYTAKFQIDSSPTPNSFDNFLFTLNDVAGTYNGTAGLADLTFYTSFLDGGFDLSFGSDFVQPSGAQLFSGPTSAPVFLPGRYRLRDFGGGPSFYSLTVAPAAVVPEPMTWALSITGLGLVGATMRRRDTSTPMRTT